MHYFYNNLLTAISYLERIFETIDEPVEVKDAKDAIEMPPIKGDVEFKDVTFTYTNKEIVLKNFNLKVKAGMSVALVGSTGSGKSTIVKKIAECVGNFAYLAQDNYYKSAAYINNSNIVCNKCP